MILFLPVFWYPMKPTKICFCEDEWKEENWRNKDMRAQQKLRRIGF